MDAAQWHQGLGLGKPMEEMLNMAGSTNNPINQNPNPQAAAAAPGGSQPQQAAAAAGAPAAAGNSNGERRARPAKEKALNCPRCNSTNTKFCYYNNYSLQQPRYFCKTCRRYWTEGGSLRNVPVGGGSRKNKRSSSSSSAAASGTISSAATNNSNKNPKLMLHDQDLNLAFPHHNRELAAFPSLESSSVAVCNPNNNGRPGAFSAMELLRSTGCYVPLQHMQHLGNMPPEYAAGFAALGDFRMPPPPPQSHHQSLLGFSLDTHTAGLQESAAAGRLLFPFEDLKPSLVNNNTNNNNGATDHHQYAEHSKDQQAGHEAPGGFWSNTIIGNGTTNGSGGGPAW